jgi:uncharacterized membrane protein YkvA (DUF1232 family)
MKKINIPHTISRNERNLIKIAYLEGVNSANSEKIEYIAKNLSKVLRRLKSSEEKWLQNVAETAEGLAKLIGKNSTIPRDGKKEIVAALYYLCDPFEIIPDYVPGKGYADDALVLNTCLVRLTKLGISLDDKKDSKDL